MNWRLVTGTLLALLATACTTPTGAATATDAVKIGVLAPLSGPVSDCGASMRRGIELAHTDPNITLVWEDTQFQSQKAVTLARKLIHKDNVDYIIGPCSSSSTLAVAPLANQTDTILFTPTAYADEISETGRNVFRAAPTAGEEVPPAVDFAERTANRTALFYLDNAFGTSYATQFSDKYNGTITLETALPPEQRDFKTLLLSARRTGTELLVIPSIVGHTTTITHQARQLGLNTTILVASINEHTAFLDAVNRSDVYVTSMLQEQETNRHRTFRETWNSAYPGYIPSRDGVESYVTMTLLEHGVGNCRTDTDCMRDFLHEQDNVTTPYGTVRVDEHGDVRWPGFVHKQLRNGRFSQAG